MTDDAIQTAQAAFWRSLTHLLQDDFGLVEALSVATAGCLDRGLSGVLSAIRDGVQQGEALSVALSKHRGLFPEQIIGMVEAGESTDGLATVTALIADGWDRGLWPACGDAEVAEPAPAAAAGDTVVDRLIREATEGLASDLHIEPLEDGARVRMRLDGILHETGRFDHDEYLAVVARLKTMAGLNVVEHRVPQDGRMLLDVGGRRVDVRVVVSPNVLGETVVARIVDKTSSPTALDDLGLTDDQMAVLSQWCEQPSGLIVFTGPAGSGRSTTLYALMAQLNQATVKIATVESPVERVVQGISQMEVRLGQGITPGEALRSQLRQDPDVLVLGALYDEETAWLAVQAAMTGHLVLTTAHTTSAPAGLRRLVDMGISPYLVNDTIIGVVSQRLVRVLCDACKAPHEPTDEELDEMALPFHMDAPTVFGPTGCEKCKGTGYRSRTGIFEVLEPTDKIRRALEQKYGADDLRQLAVETGMRALHQHGIDKVVAGITSMEESLRMTRWG